MKKIAIKTISLLLAVLLTFTSCNKFLDIYPDDKLVQQQVLTSEHSINYVLNGIYMNMAKQQNYGASLSTTVIEVLAQRYNVSNSNNEFNKLSTYTYGSGNDDEKVNAMFDGIWTNMYVQILAINDFLDDLNNTTANISESRKNILYGEAYALRALHHFDLLRLFGPVPPPNDGGAWDTEAFMPYNSQKGAELRPQLTAAQVMDSVFNDLSKAEVLLANDPIITQGIIKQQTLDLINNFYINRHLRMNYYAVKALQARANLWIDKKAEALAAANIVIDAQKRETNKLFNWTPYGTVTRLDDPDRIFSTEIIFGIYNQSLYDFFNKWFYGGLKADKELCPNKARLGEVYDDEKDYRYTSTWKAPENTSKDYLTCFKYARPSDVADYDTVYSYIQPMIRITEMYYIAAECSDDMELLKTVRRERNMTADMLGDLRTELTKEYSKEFWAEGQLFFYYKRINASSIPNGNAISGDVSLNSSKYMIPLPKSELDLR